MAVDGTMEYSLIEFSSKELDIVHVSKLRGYRVDAKKPFECICEWKVTGKSKSRSYKVKVLHDAKTRHELEPLMAHLLDGNDLESWFSAMHEPAKLGKGCREPAKKVLSSESEPEDAHDEVKQKRKTSSKSTKTHEILERIKARHMQDSQKQRTQEEVMQENKQLRAENVNLRAALAAVHTLPKTVQLLEKLVGESAEVSSATSALSSHVTSPRSQAMTVCTTPRSSGQRLSLQSSASTTSTVTTERAPSPRPTMNSPVNLSAYEDAEWFEKLQQAVIRSTSQRRDVTPSHLVNDILHVMFTKEYLGSHTVAGGNQSKQAMDPDVVRAIIDVVKQKFGDVSEGDIKQAIRQKCSNAVKALKLQEMKKIDV